MFQTTTYRQWRPSHTHIPPHSKWAPYLISPLASHHVSTWQLNLEIKSLLHNGLGPQAKTEKATFWEDLAWMNSYWASPFLSFHWVEIVKTKKQRTNA